MTDEDKLKNRVEFYFSTLEQILSIGRKVVALYAATFVDSSACGDDINYEKLLSEDPRSPVRLQQDELFESLWENPTRVIGDAIACALASGVDPDTGWLLVADTNVVRSVHSVWYMKGSFHSEFSTIFPDCRTPEHIPFVLFFKEFQKHSADPLAKSRQACLAAYDRKLHTVISFSGGVLHPLVEQMAKSVRGMLHVIIQTARYNAAVAERSGAACNGTDLATNGDAHSVCWRDALKAAEEFEKSIVDLGLVFGWREVDYDGRVRKQLDELYEKFGYDTDDD